MSLKPQTAKILAYMQNEGSISPLQALNLFGCFRLGARIYELRKAGYAIESQRVRGQNYVRYALA